ncbi:MAG: MFS transporter [Candidatus Bathyarchaeota archaeon]|nr:MAG: MFS transporter [Candidatus Bathyarchaeota archaeon]
MVDAFEPLVISSSIEELELTGAMNIIEPVIAGTTALIAGILADRTGRKRVIIFGFVSLGVAYAILSLAPIDDISWYFYFVADGVAIGALWSIFTIVIWGELAKHGVEKYYAIGEAPLFITQILYLFLPYVISVGGGAQTLAFSLAAFFLFIAVIPLLNAPETLPEKKIQQRQLRIYTEEALKLKQKVE